MCIDTQAIPLTMFQDSVDYKSIPSNPLKGTKLIQLKTLKLNNSLSLSLFSDLIAFEERIQHNMSSLHRLRFQALSTRNYLQVTFYLTFISADILDADRFIAPFLLFLFSSMARLAQNSPSTL